jgi:ABC-type antimicrobial peptide transport system permease subunit
VSGNSSLAAQRIREEVHAIDRDLPMFELHTLATELDAALVQERLIATLSSLFSVLALLLACVGLYGLLSFGVVQRMGEMGIRMALGARRIQVVRMILREALTLVALGVVISVPVALGLGRVATNRIAGLLFGVTATDPAAIGGAAGVLTIVALLAGYLPARRASRVDPASALRNE